MLGKPGHAERWRALPGMLAERKAAAAAGLTDPPPGENDAGATG